MVFSGSHSQLIMNPFGPFSQLTRLQETHPSKEQYENDSEQKQIRLHDSRTISSRKSSLRRPISSGSSGVGGSHNSVSFSFSLPGVVGLQDDVQVDQNEPKKSFMNWFSSKRQEDVEDGQSKFLKDIPLLRLASLNKPEAPVFILGSIAAAVNGVIFPIFGLLLSNAMTSFYEPPHKLRKDASFWALMYLVLAATCILVGPTQMYCFAVAGGRLVQRIRSMTFNKVVYQELGWYDNNENSSGGISARLSTDAVTVRTIVGDALSFAVQNISSIVAGIVIDFQRT